jgi:hypothetical protein
MVKNLAHFFYWYGAAQEFVFNRRGGLEPSKGVFPEVKTRL